MEIIRDVEQGSQLWFDLRAMRMTGSNATSIGNMGTGIKTYINKKMYEYYQVTEIERYKSKAMIRGNTYEPFAIEAYSAERFIDVERIGFVIHNDYVGVSPDIFVDNDGLAEIKCPEPKGYFKLLLEYKETKDFSVDSSYNWQMQMQMLVCDKKWCDYVVYSPDYEENLLIKRIYPDTEKFAKLRRGFDIGEQIITQTVKIMEAA